MLAAALIKDVNYNQPLLYLSRSFDRKQSVFNKSIKKASTSLSSNNIDNQTKEPI